MLTFKNVFIPLLFIVFCFMDINQVLNYSVRLCNKYIVIIETVFLVFSTPWTGLSGLQIQRGIVPRH